MGTYWERASQAYKCWVNDKTKHQFKCVYCRHLFQSRGDLCRHLEAFHHVHIRKYERDNPDHVVCKVPVRCGLCDREEVENLGTHLREEHGGLVEPETYFIR